VAELLLRWIAERIVAEDARPFFAFGLLDSPHQTYSFPTEDPPFQPYVGKVDYLALSRSLDPERIAGLWNSYRNAVHHADEVLGRIVAGLEELGVLEETLVLVTSDHGEEFGENGFWGHTSNFTREQALVPLLLFGPGIEPGTEPRPTSHVDVVATLLEAVGVDPSLRASYSNGASLLDPDPVAQRVVAGWDTVGLWTREGIVVVPFEAHRGFSFVVGYDWRPLEEQEQVLAALAGDQVQLAIDCGRFLR